MEGTKPHGKREYAPEEPRTPPSGKNSTATPSGIKADDVKGPATGGNIKQSEESGVAEMRDSLLSSSPHGVPDTEQSSGGHPRSTATGGSDKSDHLSVSGGEASAFEGTEKPAERCGALSLIEMLTHSNEKLRVEAIESLLKVGDKSISYAFASAMKDTSFRVRLGALRGLYKFSGDAATEYLIAALEDIHPDVRRRALIYLGWMRKREVLPFITDALSDPIARVRKVAAYALGDIKDTSAIPYLLKSLDDTDEEVTKAALAALKRITGTSAPSEQAVSAGDQHALISTWKEWWNKEKR